MPVVIRDIVNAVITDLSQVPGVATQIYSSGRIQQHVQDAFLLEFEDFWWPDYMAYVQSPLDGTTGRLTQDLIGPLGAVTEYRDIASVWPVGLNRKLRELPQSVNPTVIAGGSNTWYMMPDYVASARPFKVIPETSTGSVVAWARQRPEVPFDIDDVVYIDGLLLQYDAAWMYCVDDGTVPAQVNKFQVLAQNRRTKVKASFNQQPIELDPRMTSTDAMSDGAESTWFIVEKHPLA